MKNGKSGVFLAFHFFCVKVFLYFVVYDCMSQKLMGMKTVSYKVYGKVQGVFYRASTLEKATKLGLKGFVRNQPDGSVYIEATGDESQLQALEQWCKQGPLLSNVREVVAEDLPDKEFEGFTVE